MLVSQVRSGFVCSDWENGKIEIIKNVAELSKYGAVAGITGVEYFLFGWSLDDKTAPQSFVLIE